MIINFIVLITLALLVLLCDFGSAARILGELFSAVVAPAMRIGGSGDVLPSPPTSAMTRNPITSVRPWAQAVTCPRLVNSRNPGGLTAEASHVALAMALARASRVQVPKTLMPYNLTGPQPDRSLKFVVMLHAWLLQLTVTLAIVMGLIVAPCMGSLALTSASCRA